MTADQILHHIDEEVLQWTKKINLAKYLRPTNISTERKRFVQEAGRYDPQFTYDFPLASEIMSRIQALRAMQAKYFDGKTYTHKISKLLADKIQSHIQHAYLLLAYSQQNLNQIQTYNKIIFGDTNPEILQYAKDILVSYQEANPATRGAILTGDEIQQYILAYMHTHNISGIQLVQTKHILSKFVIGFGAKDCFLYYSPTMKIRKHALEADLIHELGVHYTRHQRGKQTGRHILSFGTQNYLTDEEGLAIYQVCAYKKTLYPAFQKVGIYQKYILLDYGQNASFSEMAHYIYQQGWSKQWKYIFDRVLRYKQGIQDTSLRHPGTIFAKNKVYADGLHRIQKRVSDGHDISTLLQGKVSIDDLTDIAG